MQSFSQDSVALLAADFRRVDANPAGELVEQFYSELRRLAASRMKGERTDHTWQTTALVNELYLEFLKVRNSPRVTWFKKEDKAAFLGFAGQLMRRLLIHHARPLSHQIQKVQLEESRALRTKYRSAARGRRDSRHRFWRQSIPNSDPWLRCAFSKV